MFDSAEHLFEAMKAEVPKLVARTSESILSAFLPSNSELSRNFMRTFPSVIQTVTSSALLTVAHSNYARIKPTITAHALDAANSSDLESTSTDHDGCTSPKDVREAISEEATSLATTESASSTDSIANASRMPSITDEIEPMANVEENHSEPTQSLSDVVEGNQMPGDGTGDVELVAAIESPENTGDNKQMTAVLVKMEPMPVEATSSEPSKNAPNTTDRRDVEPMEMTDGVAKPMEMAADVAKPLGVQRIANDPINRRSRGRPKSVLKSVEQPDELRANENAVDTKQPTTDQQAAEKAENKENTQESVMKAELAMTTEAVERADIKMSSIAIVDLSSLQEEKRVRPTDHKKTFLSYS